MTNARPNEVGTGAVVNVPGGHAHGSASDRRVPACRTLHVELGPRRTSWCAGTPGVRDLLDRLGVPSMYDRRRRAWAVPTNRLDDVLAAARHQERRTVTVRDGGAR